MAAHRAGDLAKAEKLYRSLLKLDPTQPDTLGQLADVLRRRGRLAEAQKTIQRAIESDPRRGALHTTAGQIHLAAGRAEKASTAFRRVLELQPRGVDARCDLAAALERTGDLEEAEAVLREAVAIDGRSVRAWHDLAGLLLRGTRYDEADACVDELLGAAPSQVAGWIMRGNIARARDDGDTAVASYEKATELQPRNAAAWLNLGQVHAESGHAAEAVAAYRRASEIAPESPEPRILIALARRHTERDKDVAVLERIAKDPKRTGLEPHVALFALAKTLEDLGEHDRVFDVLLRANAAKRKTFEYDVAEDDARFRRIREVFTPELLARYAGGGCPDETPVFVVGMPRSATSLVEQILSSHRGVHGAGEIEDFCQIVTDSSRFPGGYPDGFVDASPEALRAAGEEYVARVRRRAPSALRVVDKSPLNAVLIGAIRAVLEGAKVIACQRDPRDTCWSIFRHDFAGDYRFGYDLAELGRYHRLHAELMEHWRAVVAPDHLLEVRYEALVEDLEGHARRMCEFVGLDWDPACLEFHRTERPVRTASAQQVRQPIFRSSIGAWRRHEARLGPLLDALGDLC